MSDKISVEYVPLSSLSSPDWNPRTWSKEATAHLEESITSFGLLDPLLVNCAPGRKGIIIGGNFRAKVAKKLGIKDVPVVWINIPDLAREKELCLRLNRNTGDWSYKLLAELGSDLLKEVGFSGMELDDIFAIDETPEVFNLEAELKKMDIQKVTVQKGEVYEIAGCRIMNGDSTIEADMLKLMNGETANLCLTDPPYILDYLHGKKKKDATSGFGLKRDRTYLGTTELPENFSDLWMDNVAKIQKPDFSIIVYENPKNLRTIWNALEKHWKYRNTIIWHLPNRVQGFSAKYKFFNKFDFAMLGTSGEVSLNDQPESDALLQEEYETALFATSGSPYWEGYKKGKKYAPTDFIQYKASDAKSSGQSIIFGTKPVEILIPYLKVLTKRGDLIIEPFGGSGSSAVAAIKMNRRCYVMEKSNVYTAVILKRLERLTGQKARRVYAEK